ncbi:MAG TPA: choice-of-anchor tandem repeat GloVer-containing protein [Rhizomicrobium sp.]
MTRHLFSLLLASVCALALPAPVLAGSFSVLHVFRGGKDGGVPDSALVPDGLGNFYGTTSIGGNASCGCGMVFRMAADGTMTKLYKFRGGSDGAQPWAGVTFGPDGALYGTTIGGGGTNDNCYGFTCGTVFRLTTEGKEKVLHRFAAGSDGASPEAAVTLDAMGNIYGTTMYGGSGDNGTVYKVSPDGQETVLHAFYNDGHDGIHPAGRLAMDKSGNLYGTTVGGGSKGAGTVFKVTPGGKETIFHTFTGTDGSLPSSDLKIDKDGNLYGTTERGGGYGTIFKLTPAGAITVLYTFQTGPTGFFPLSGVIADKAGNLYGTTTSGGAAAFGTAYKLTPDGSLFILHNFTGGQDGGNPRATLAADGFGNFYGTASDHGSFHRGDCSTYGCGTVFRLTP